jgi:hypothetical protein
LSGALALRQRLFETSLEAEELGIPLVPCGVVRIQLDGAPKLSFSGRPVPIVNLGKERHNPDAYDLWVDSGMTNVAAA